MAHAAGVRGLPSNRCRVTAIRPPSLDVPEFEKRGFSEADVHSTLFDPDMVALGYPRRASSQADGEYFVE